MTKAQKIALLEQQIADAQEALYEAARILADKTTHNHDARPAASIEVGKALGVLSFDINEGE